MNAYQVLLGVNNVGEIEWDRWVLARAFTKVLQAASGGQLIWELGASPNNDPQLVTRTTVPDKAGQPVVLRVTLRYSPRPGVRGKYYLYLGPPDLPDGEVLVRTDYDERVEWLGRCLLPPLARAS